MDYVPVLGLPDIVKHKECNKGNIVEPSNPVKVEG
jgi:hypothetical protein